MEIDIIELLCTLPDAGVPGKILDYLISVSRSGLSTSSLDTWNDVSMSIQSCQFCLAVYQYERQAMRGRRPSDHRDITAISHQAMSRAPPYLSSPSAIIGLCRSRPSCPMRDLGGTEHVAMIGLREVSETPIRPFLSAVPPQIPPPKPKIMEQSHYGEVWDAHSLLIACR